MAIRVSGKNMDIGDALRTQVETRVETALGKYFDGHVTGHVTVSPDGAGYHVECVLHLASGVTLDASGNAHDVYAAFDQAAERIAKQLRRYKRRLKDHSSQASGRGGDILVEGLG